MLVVGRGEKEKRKKKKKREILRATRKVEEEDCVVGRWGLKKVLGQSGQAWSGFGVKVNGISTAYLGELPSTWNLARPGHLGANDAQTASATLELELLLPQPVQLMGPRPTRGKLTHGPAPHARCVPWHHLPHEPL